MHAKPPGSRLLTSVFFHTPPLIIILMVADLCGVAAYFSPKCTVAAAFDASSSCRTCPRRGGPCCSSGQHPKLQRAAFPSCSRKAHAQRSLKPHSLPGAPTMTGEMFLLDCTVKLSSLGKLMEQRQNADCSARAACSTLRQRLAAVDELKACSATACGTHVPKWTCQQEGVSRIMRCPWMSETRPLLPTRCHKRRVACCSRHICVLEASPWMPGTSVLFRQGAPPFAGGKRWLDTR